MTTVDLSVMGQQAKQAARMMSRVPTAQKNAAVMALADYLNQNETEILDANGRDKEAARSAGLSEAMIDRLSLTWRIASLADDVRKIARLPDPVGEEFEGSILPNGLHVCKRRTPIGVLGVIYESRPNVTVDVAAIAIKTGNCAILRGGSEALQTNLALLKAIQKALDNGMLHTHAIQMIPTTDREEVKNLLQLHESVDLIIPRGGNQLHQYCRENSTIPVITGGIGICHLFVDETADQERSIDVIYNAKTQRPTVCNALDTLLVHAAIASNFIPKVIQRLSKAQVKIRLDGKSWAVWELLSHPLEGVSQAQAEDWDCEWLSLVLGIKIVQNLDEAVQHIQQHSTGHSDGILTQSHQNSAQFLKEIDSAAVYVNASTRFTDGGQLGLGAEVAISTQKLHARGPMGLRELTTYKWIIQGDYHVRS